MDRSPISVANYFDQTGSSSKFSPRLPQLASLNETHMKQYKYNVDILTGKKLISPRGILYKDTTKKTKNISFDYRTTHLK